MRLADFSVRVFPGREDLSGYVLMEHNSVYGIELSNFGDRKCDAEVNIDGEHVGTWRVPAGKSIILERPVHDDGCFTFYRFGTVESRMAGLKQSSELGLISVLFKPEYRSSGPQVLFSRRSSGGTGLSGRSDQRFTEAKPISYDEKSFVFIHLRLVCENDGPRPMFSTRIPPPVG